MMVVGRFVAVLSDGIMQMWELRSLGKGQRWVEHLRRPIVHDWQDAFGCFVCPTGDDPSG
jgi:hypothetical protein